MLNKIYLWVNRHHLVYLWSFKYQFLLVVSSSIILGLGLFFMLLNELTLKINQATENRVMLQANIQSKQKIAAMLPVYESNLLLLTKLEEQVNQHISDGASNATLLLKIHQLANNNNLVIEKFTPGEVSVFDTSNIDKEWSSKSSLILQQQVIQIQANATYLSFYNFIHDIAKLNQNIHLQKIELTKIEDKNNLNSSDKKSLSSKLNVLLELQIVFRKSKSK